MWRMWMGRERMDPIRLVTDRAALPPDAWSGRVGVGSDSGGDKGINEKRTGRGELNDSYKLI